MKGQEKVVITMQDMMEQMDISDKTLHRMIEDGHLPDFTYGSKYSKKKGWHSAVLERHAMEKYEKSQSIKNACHIAQVSVEDMGVTLFRGRHAGVSENLTHLKNGSSRQKKLRGKKVS